MDEILKREYTTLKLKQLNVCKLYLQVTHVCDIIQPNGKNIDIDFLIGVKKWIPSLYVLVAETRQNSNKCVEIVE